MKSFLFFLTAACSGFLVADASRGLAADASPEGLLVVVMDPLAAPLSCPCVEGYAQRKYECLGEYLQTHLDRPVDVVFAEALSVALKKHPGRKPAVIIGKDSVVRADAKKAGLRAKHLACLTGKDGATTQTGLIVVAAEDPATEVADLKDYRIFFGTADCSEKYDAAAELLRAAKIALPEQRETTQACSEGACQVLDLRGSERAAAVISSYAKPLLEGCGTIKKGELKVIGETEPVPFIGAFVTEAVSEDVQDQIRESLLRAGTDAELCKALETLLGFVPAQQDPPAAAKKKSRR